MNKLYSLIAILAAKHHKMYRIQEMEVHLKWQWEPERTKVSKVETQCGSDFITNRKRAGEEADREQSSTNFQPRFSVPFTMMTQVFRAKLWCRCVSVALSRLAINLIVYKQNFICLIEKRYNFKNFLTTTKYGMDNNSVVFGCNFEIWIDDDRREKMEKSKILTLDYLLIFGILMKNF